MPRQQVLNRIARHRRYAACITLALEYLHHQKAPLELAFKAMSFDLEVVFRDLKPDNVLITFKAALFWTSFCCDGPRG